MFFASLFAGLFAGIGGWVAGRIHFRATQLKALDKSVHLPAGTIEQKANAAAEAAAQLAAVLAAQKAQQLLVSSGTPQQLLVPMGGQAIVPSNVVTPTDQGP